MRHHSLSHAIKAITRRSVPIVCAAIIFLSYLEVYAASGFANVKQASGSSNDYSYGFQRSDKYRVESGFIQSRRERDRESDQRAAEESKAARSQNIQTGRRGTASVPGASMNPRQGSGHENSRAARTGVTTLVPARTASSRVTANVDVRALIETATENVPIAQREGFKSAYRHIEGAARRGDVNYQRSLGDMYSLGVGAPLDTDKAIFWYKKAAFQKDAGAAMQLGQLYWNIAQESGDRDAIRRAYAWVKVLSMRGNGTGDVLMDQYRASMSQRDIEHANRLAEDIVRDIY